MRSSTIPISVRLLSYRRYDLGPNIERFEDFSIAPEVRIAQPHVVGGKPPAEWAQTLLLGRLGLSHAEADELFRSAKVSLISSLRSPEYSGHIGRILFARAELWRAEHLDHAGLLFMRVNSRPSEDLN